MIFHIYGLFISLGIWLGLIAAQKAQKKLGKINTAYLDYELESMLIWILPLGLIGARIYHVVDLWPYYQQNLNKIFYVWEGGLGIWGGIMGGLIGLLAYYFLINKKINFLIILDLIAFGLPIGQAVGRLGNFFNQELYGKPTGLPWGIYIKPENRLENFASINFYHPLFFYETLFNLLLFAWLWIRLKQKNTNGYFYIYLIGYGLIRFSLDFLRLNPWQFGPLTVAQWISLIAILIGFIGLITKMVKLKFFCYN